MACENKRQQHQSGAWRRSGMRQRNGIKKSAASIMASAAWRKISYQHRNGVMA